MHTGAHGGGVGIGAFFYIDLLLLTLYGKDLVNKTSGCHLLH